MSTEEQAPAIPSGLALTSLDPGFRDNPHDVLDMIRAAGRVFEDPVLGRKVLTHAEDIEAVLRDRDLCVDPRKAPQSSFMSMLADRDSDGRGTEPSMLFLDPPDHDRLRGLVNKAFTRKAVERMHPRIEAVAAELLDAVEGRDDWDVIADYSAPLPTIVIAEMLGVDPGDQARFKAWSDIVVQGLNPFLSPDDRAKVNAAGAELDEYLAAAVEARRADRKDDLITAMIEAEEQGDQLTDAEIVTMVSLLLLAGNLTTTDLIGNGVLALLRHREAWDALRADPSLIDNAVEEMLRYDPPVTQSGRLTLKDMEVGGCPVAAGSSFAPILLAGNHDPALHPDPHRFDIRRDDIRHMSFGGGRRYCLGAPLARLETQVAVMALIQRYPDLQLATEAVEHKTMPGFRGLARLPVRNR
jgi:cytochrome P450